MPLTQSLKAACFDLDGTLIDTGPLHAEAERLALASLGIPELAEDHPVTFGTGVMPGIQILVDHYNLQSAQHVLDAYLPAWESVFETGLKPMIGADEALRALASRNVPLALVTSGEDEYVDAVLARFNWTSLFDHRVTLESVKRLKPDPEPYLLAARLLGLEPRECAGFEDSASGLRALKAANVYSVIVHHDQTDRPELAGADMAITGLDLLDSAVIDQLFG
jgi:HAD superfamily hydrolase (TIGR01509 family)